MQVPLQSYARKAMLLSVAWLFAAGFAVLISAEFTASVMTESSNLATLERAAKVQPWNAEYRYRIGVYHSLLQEPNDAARWFRSAVWLNPHRARYWLDLLATYQTLDNQAAQRDAVEHAVLAEPTDPTIAWEAANSYVTQGETDKALDQFRVVLANAPTIASNAMQLCWRIKPNVDVFLDRLLPPRADLHVMFLQFLFAKRETQGAAKVWQRIVQLEQPIERGNVFAYLGYLISQKEVEQAQLVWRQSSRIADLADYQPTRENLIVNGDFSLNVLNGGFDWTYYKLPDVSLALDPIQSHTGHRSLLITFSKAKIAEAGIQQLVLVRPNTTYDFSGYFRSEQIEGAGGVHFALQDVYDNKVYFASEELRGADFWKQVGGVFTTGPETKLLLLRVLRDPPGDVIQGKLWIDGLRLIEKRQEE